MADVKNNAQATVGDTYFTTLSKAIAAAADNDTVTLLSDFALESGVTVPGGKELTLDLNGKTITGTDNATGSFGLINIQPGAELTINDTVGTGKITLTSTTDRDWNAYSSVISNQRGKLTVNGGIIEHLGGTDMAYAIDNLTNGKGTYAETIINGGTIKSTYRAVRQFLNGTEAQNILTVNGGTIEGTNKSIWLQDPSTNANTGTLTVGENAVVKGDIYLFVTAGSAEWPVEISISAAALKENSTVVTGNIPDGYLVEEINGVWGVVPALPTATVTELENEVLTFALNFTADTATEAQLLYYGDWFADYVLTVNKDITFNASDKTADGYLSGQYDAWSENWVDVPFEDVTLKAGESIKIMEYAAEMLGQSGLKLTYNYVYEFVKDFNCGVYLNPAFIAENPDFEISLELRMFNPVDETISYTIGETYEFVAPALVAEVDGVKYSDLQKAIDNANGKTVKLLSDIALEETATIGEDSKITLDLNGKTLKGAILAPSADITVKNGSIVNENSSVSAIEINSGSLNLSNTNISSARHAVRIDGAVEAVIDGGKYTLIGTSGTRHAVNVSGTANVIIKAGEFVGPAGTTMDSGSAVCVQSDANVKIEGGTFTGGKAKTLGVAGRLSVSGGSYDDNSVANYVADGYEITANPATGLFDVVEDTHSLFEQLLVIYNMEPVEESGVKYHPVNVYAAIDSLKYKEVGFKLTAVDTNSNTSSYNKQSTTTVYKAMDVQQPDGQVFEYVAKDLDKNGTHMFGQVFWFTASKWKNDNTILYFTPYAEKLDGTIVDGITKKLSNSIAKEIDPNYSLFKEEN